MNNSFRDIRYTPLDDLKAKISSRKLYGKNQTGFQGSLYNYIKQVILKNVNPNVYTLLLITRVRDL